MLEFSKFKDGDGLSSAAATIYDPAAIARTPKLANIGGAIWCSFVDGTNNDILLRVTRYWGTYDTTNYPASWTGPEAQFLHDGLWVTPGGGDASNGDSYDIDSNYAYGADRMVMLTPSRPSRSTADNADWSAPFDLGENKVVNVDTIAVMANVRECKFQGDLRP